MMNMNRLNEIAFKAMGRRKAHLQREKGFIFYHGERVAKLSINLRKILFPADHLMDEIIYAGGLFHDVTKGIEPLNKTGAQLVKTILKEECSEQELHEIAEIIELHNSRNEKDLPFHIKIVQDADILDHFGSMDIWLKFIYSAHKEENVLDAVSFWNSPDYAEYIKTSRDLLNYEISKEMFDKRIEFQKGFQKQFESECNGCLFD